MSLFSRTGQVTFGPLPAKSEVGLAITYNSSVVPLGEMSPRPFGATPKSSVRRTITASFFEDLEKEWCGEVGYWRSPIFKGTMTALGWVSPW